MQQTTNIKNKDDFIYGVFLPGNDHLRIIASAFREYKDAGKTMEDFEEDYGCLLEFDKTHTRTHFKRLDRKTRAEKFAKSRLGEIVCRGRAIARSIGRAYGYGEPA